jgi:hypothetical protein
MAGRDTDATWRSLSTLCRELDWSRPRLLHELRNGLRYRTFPPGYTVDWHDTNVERSLDVEASTVTLMLGVLDTNAGVPTEGDPDAVHNVIIVYDFNAVALPNPVPVGIEVLPPTDAEVPLPAASKPAIQWAIAATRNLRAEGKIPEGTRKAALARLLESEAQKAVRAGQITRSLKASYLEDQLVPWGIWPLSSLE